MNTVGIIQARIGSTRLPGKILAPIAGRPLLGVLIERIKRSKRVDDWWLATSDQRSDDVTERWGEALGLPVFRGHLDDVLARFVGALERSGLNDGWVVRLTADDPFVDGAVIDALVAQASCTPPGTSMISELPTSRRLPLGYVPQIARIEEVLELPKLISDPRSPHRSHVLSWFIDKENSEQFEVPESWGGRPQWRWTVDTTDDLMMADTAFRLFGEAWRDIDYPSMVRALDERPEIVSLNARVIQKGLSEG